MKITPLEITARDLSDGYDDREEEGVFGYGGRLDIRPPYQREFIYKDKQRDAPWHLGGKTTEGNCQVLCKDDNRRKSGK